jgi:hypothetical protein
MLPKKGRILPKDPGAYALAIAQALNQRLGDTHQGIKIAMRWTGAAERTVKNWFAGVSGPSGEHLISLLRHSDEVLEVILILAGRERSIASKKLIDARHKLGEVLALVQSLTDDNGAEF